MFKSKTEEKFLKTCNTQYEDLMEPHYDSCKSQQEFELAHQRTKAQILEKLPEKWKEASGGKKMSSKLTSKVATAMDDAFAQLKGHFEFSSHLSAEQEALKMYKDEMDKFVANGSNLKMSALSDAHEKYSAAAKKYFLTSPEFDQRASIRVSESIRSSYDEYKSQAQRHEKAMKDPAIGIDLGTTMCCVMIYFGGDLKVIPNRSQGSQNTTPSYVQYLDDGSDTFGYVAKEQAYRHPETTIYDAKRMIGRMWNDKELQNDRKHWPFEVVQEKERPAIKAWGITRHPHEVSARLLAQFRVMAEEHLGKPTGSITKAVITVPAYFTEPQRRATSDAAKMAGLDVLNILSEPTAAAIAYSWERRNREETRTALIYDFGGGTFDVSIARVKSDQVQILAVDGDTHLGGQDIDQLLMDYCIAEFKKTENVDLVEGKTSDLKTQRDKVRSRLSRLKGQCEVAKIRLTAANKITVDVERIFEEKHMSVTVTRDKLEELIRPIVQKSIEIVGKSLEKVKSKGVRNKGDIDDVILVGGTTRIPLVKKMLSDFFGDKQLCENINPDEAVAYGAAIQAFILNNEDTPKPIEVLDVTPMTLGIEILGDKFSRIVDKNSTIPCKESLIYVTVYDNQTEARITIYQGEKDIATQNKYLGEFVIGGLAKKRAGQEEIEVLMKIDGNGMLHVDAKSLSTGSSKGITVASDRLAIDEATMKKMQKQMMALAVKHRN